MSSSYDEIPYPSRPASGTHPSHLAAVARVFGMVPAPPAKCRVLELGCASGGNLLPLAVDFPESEFIGIDLSSRQITEGRAVVDQLRLKNLDLQTLDLNRVGEQLGTFHYIICHGVYSWVPRSIQDRILEIGRKQLAPNGVLFVSYNTFPGWHLRGVVRDMMVYHVREIADPKTKIAQARALLDFLVDAAVPPREAYLHLLRDEAAVLRPRDDGYLYHEHLEDVNEPFYFHQFVERIDEAGLQYLGDTDVASMLPTEFSDEVASLLKHATLVQQEQYLDFLRNRMFRGTLLCHRNLEITHQIDPRRLAACDVGLEKSINLSNSQDLTTELVCDTSVGKIRVASPLIQAAVHVLSESWPGCVTFDSLLQESCRRAAAVGSTMDESTAASELASNLLSLYLRNLVRVWEQAPACVAQPGEYPLATPLACWQARRSDVVFNRRHRAVRLTALQAHLLGLLDGTRDRGQLRKQLRDDLQQGTVAAPEELLDSTDTDDRIGELVDATLNELASQALLIR